MSIVEIAWLACQDHLFEQCQQSSVSFGLYGLLIVEEKIDFAIEVLANVIRAQREIPEEIDEANDDSASIIIRTFEGEMFWPAEHTL